MGRSLRQPLEEYETAIEEKKAPPKTVALDPSTGAVTVQASGTGPVPALMAGLLGLAKSGGLDGSLLTSNQFFQTDYTSRCCFMADGGLLGERAEAQHCSGAVGQDERSGSYSGQAWLWLYTLWLSGGTDSSPHPTRTYR